MANHQVELRTVTRLRKYKNTKGLDDNDVSGDIRGDCFSNISILGLFKGYVKTHRPPLHRRVRGMSVMEPAA